MINSTYQLGSALTAYLESGRSRRQADDAKTEGQATTVTADAGAAATRTTSGISQSALERSPASFKTLQARKELDKTQQAIAQDLRAALAKAGATLKGEVSFSLDAKGGITVKGSAEDKAAVTAALKADTSSPSLSSRIEALSDRAETVEGNSRRSAAIMQAARHAGNAAGLMSLYTSLMSQQGETSATFSLSDKSSQMVFKGMVDSTA